MSVTVHRLGLVEYPDGLELQRQFQDARKVGLVDDTLLLLQHPPVLTLGRGAKPDNILTPRATLEAMGVGLFETDRGGDVTYHGPGQIVGYPLLLLPSELQDVRRYVRSIEEVIIRALADFGVIGARLEQWPGVWIERSRAGGPRKICALGVHLSRWYTRHGFALNVQPNLAHFELIVPCGIKEAGVTSMAVELGHEVELAQVEERLAHHFGQVFSTPVEQAPAPVKTVAVAVVREAVQVLALRRSEERGGFWQLVTGRVEAGETPRQAAARELGEETALALELRPLDYVHCFAWGEPRRDEHDQVLEPPRVAEESAFVAHAPAHAQVRLGPEHTQLEWLTLEQAQARFPFQGLREAAGRALRMAPHQLVTTVRPEPVEGPSTSLGLSGAITDFRGAVPKP